MNDEFIPETPEYLKPWIRQASYDFGVPTKLLSALLYQESGFNPKAKSKAGAIGIAQLMPATARSYGIDPTDPFESIRGAAMYLRDAYKEFGSWEKALAAYNAGSGAVRKYKGIPPYKETQNYVRSIMNKIQQAIPRPSLVHPAMAAETSSTAPTTAQVPTKIPTPQMAAQRLLMHTVKPGETLWGIAQRYLGSGSRYPELTGYRSGNPSLIYPGEVIKIPRR